MSNRGKSRSFLSMRCDIDKFRGDLGVHDFLLAVKAEISGQHITDGGCQKVPEQSLCPEQLQTEKKRRNGAIRNATEKTEHTDCGSERRIEAEQ